MPAERAGHRDQPAEQLAGGARTPAHGTGSTAAVDWLVDYGGRSRWPVPAELGHDSRRRAGTARDALSVEKECREPSVLPRAVTGPDVDCL